MQQFIIQTHRLTRYFGSRCVVRDLSLAIPHGQITALPGLNGAGKTTTIRIIMGLLRPTRGRSEVFGEETSVMSPETRMRIGYMVEGHFLYPSITVRECAQFQRAGYSHWGEKLFDQIVTHFGISQSTRAGELSRGQRAGVSLALVLAPNPELLVLDDPALGLDPVSRRALNETLLEFAGSGQRTVLLSTHLLDDVERVADRVMLMVGGRLKVDATLVDFQSRVTGYMLELAEADAERVHSVPRLVEARRFGNRMKVVVADADDETRTALAQLGGKSVEPESLTFGDAVLAYLARERPESSFISSERRSV
jgi:ABC-2 type transport system ATP-binding protein